MHPRPALFSNFAALGEHDEQFLRIGMLTERYFAEDPNTCLLKLRQLAEVLAQTTASHVGLYLKPEESQYDLLSRLRERGILPPGIYQLFGEIRRSGNAANHALQGDHRTALAMLRISWQIAVWFHRAFIPPHPPAAGVTEGAAEFSFKSQEWRGTKPGRPSMLGIVLYARIDGGFSLWDPARNY